MSFLREENMKIGIAGARGSLPTPSGKTLFGAVETEEFGGNTTCVYVQADDGSEHILDAGTGIRALGVHLAREGGLNGKGKRVQLYLSHTHWDHIQGLPFFTPGYIEGNHVAVFGEAKVKNVHFGTKETLDDLIQSHEESVPLLQVDDAGIKKNLQGQQNFRNFPAPLEAMKGLTAFYDFVAGETIYQSKSLKVETFPQQHPGGSVGYKFTERKKDGSTKVMVFSTDFEPQNGNVAKMTERWAGADLVLADAQYEPRGSQVKENPFMEGWGHSDYITDVKMATHAEIKRLVLTHHEPKMGDNYHRALELRAQGEAETVANALRKNKVAVELAREGKWYEL